MRYIQPLPLAFIRAPWIETAGPAVQVLRKLDGRIVATQQESMAVTSFHSELTNNLTMHTYFAELVCQTQTV